MATIRIHYLKLNIDFCDDVLSGNKNFEVRYNDRGYQTGDLIEFIPYDGKPCTHEISNHRYRIKYVLNGWGLKDGYVALAIEES